MIRTLVALHSDERGFIITAELVLITTILVIGLIVGLSCVQAAVVGELTDISYAFRNLDQTYWVRGFWGCKARTVGSAFYDRNFQNVCAVVSTPSIGVGTASSYTSSGYSSSVVTPGPIVSSAAPVVVAPGQEICPPAVAAPVGSANCLPACCCCCCQPQPASLAPKPDDCLPKATPAAPHSAHPGSTDTVVPPEPSAPNAPASEQPQLKGPALKKSSLILPDPAGQFPVLQGPTL